jgi:hypothetical protein
MTKHDDNWDHEPDSTWIAIFLIAAVVIFVTNALAECYS